MELIESCSRHCKITLMVLLREMDFFDSCSRHGRITLLLLWRSRQSGRKKTAALRCAFFAGEV